MTPEQIAGLAVQYVNELLCPAPDLVMRRYCRDRLIEGVNQLPPKEYGRLLELGQRYVAKEA